MRQRTQRRHRLFEFIRLSLRLVLAGFDRLSPSAVLHRASVRSFAESALDGSKSQWTIKPERSTWWNVPIVRDVYSLMVLSS